MESITLKTTKVDSGESPRVPTPGGTFVMMLRKISRYGGKYLGNFAFWDILLSPFPGC